MWGLLGFLNQSIPVSSRESGEDLNAKQIKQMESVGFGEIFDERGCRKGGGKAGRKIFTLGDWVVDGATETGNTEGQTLVNV